MRKNINLTILMFNNQIYGLTKGQYSPTSELGKITKSTPFGSLETPFNPVTLTLGAEASFVARTHDMDRQHMTEVFRRAHDHKGASFVEIYQNCNVFNDGAFETITAKDKRADMLIPLEHGKPVVFGADGDKCVVVTRQGRAEIRTTADTDPSDIAVHDERSDRGLAVVLSRLAEGPHEPTPIGVFRAAERPEYGDGATRQIAQAQDRSGPGDLAALLTSGATWTVG
jgi:2-oxoglutarate ferredoxin oxidoreductase subunit beta